MKSSISILIVLATVLGSGDGRADSILSADAVSNLTPRLQLAAIRATLDAPDECGNEKQVQITRVTSPLKRPVRILDAVRLRATRKVHELEVEAIGPRGEILETRHVNIRITDESQAVTVVLDGTPCGAKGQRPCPRQAAEPPVRGITMVLRTGNDDLRGGHDNVNAIVQFTNGNSQAYFNINRGHRWADRCTARVDLTFDRPVQRTQVHSVRLFTDSQGSSGDNWDLALLQIQDERTGHLYYRRFGSPLHRFTGKRRDLLVTF